MPGEVIKGRAIIIARNEKYEGISNDDIITKIAATLSLQLKDSLGPNNLSTGNAIAILNKEKIKVEAYTGPRQKLNNAIKFDIIQAMDGSIKFTTTEYK